MRTKPVSRPTLRQILTAPNLRPMGLYSHYGLLPNLTRNTEVTESCLVIDTFLLNCNILPLFCYPVLRRCTIIIVPDSDLFQPNTHLNSPGNVQHMLPFWRSTRYSLLRITFVFISSSGPANTYTLSQRCNSVARTLHFTLYTRASVDSQERCHNVVFDVVSQRITTLHATLYARASVDSQERCHNVVFDVVPQRITSLHATLYTRASVDSQDRCHNVVFDVVLQRNYNILTHHAHIFRILRKLCSMTTFLLYIYNLIRV
jgi:hypothetical protein